jgi:hypothetical protein
MVRKTPSMAPCKERQRERMEQSVEWGQVAAQPECRLQKSSP